jgi:hypothetical protein
MSTFMNLALPPVCFMAASAFFADSSFTSSIKTFAPLSAKSFAASKPIPRPAPVIAAIFPIASSFYFLFF